ncbi:hypothetical protein FRC11_004454 [Ceratobasidium sp. 423]|nr:hypothetical protein FRC11_004454 [Ceratobasidium sp. 423]
MSNAIIDLTASDDEVQEASRPTSRASNSTRVRRGRARRGKGVTQNAGETEITENAQSGSSSAGKSGGRSEQAKSNSLLSRLGMIPHENKKENSKSKRNSRDRPPGEKGNDYRGRVDASHKQTEISQTGGTTDAHHRWSRSPSPNRPKEIPLSELPVERLFFVDTGLPAGAGGEQEHPSPLGTGTGSTTPSTPGTSAIPDAGSIKKKLAKERKREPKALAEGKVPRDTSNGAPNEVEFIGGSALVVEDQTVTSDTVISAAGMITALSTSVTESIQVGVVRPTSGGGTKSNDLSLPEHVTLWVEEDGVPSLEDAAAAPETEEGIEYLDYEDSQATGVPRYFAPESATSSKKACRTCGEEGHIARNCKKLIDCKDTKPFSAPAEPCAFGSFNASRGPFGDLDNMQGRSRDVPRPAWMDDDPHLQDVGRRAKEANMKRSRAAEASRIARDRDDEDDWFSRAGSSRDQHQVSDRTKGNLPTKPKFSFQSRDTGGGSSRHPSGGHDSTRDRERDRRREKDRDKGHDNERRKRGRDYEDERQYHRRRDYDDDSRRHRDYRDWRDEERRSMRPGSGSERRGDRDRHGPQYRGSYA